MATEPKKYQVIVASDVLERDGIGVEVYDGDEMIIEIFRDDTKKSRVATFLRNPMPLEELEQCIAFFKKHVDWDFINYDEWPEKS